VAVANVSSDPIASAHAAGLRYVDPETTPGFRRVRKGPLRSARGSRDAFVYFDAEGLRLRDPAILARIRRLAIPPAWRDVWVCSLLNGHIQAVGRDAKGRKQYRYEPRWREVRDATKFHKLIAFSRALPRMRAACARDLARRGLPKNKVLAACVRLLELTHIRVGNEEYTRTNGSFGLTTLRARHVRILGSLLYFHFRGKSGQTRDVALDDRQLARIVAACSELPGQELFQYVADDGSRHAIDSSDVNEYITRIAGEAYSAKDFRTWAGTVLAVRALCARPLAPTGARIARDLVACVKEVARHLGNTPAVCKRSYIHPAVFDAYRLRALTPESVRRVAEEVAVRRLLLGAARQTDEAALVRALRASLSGRRSLRRPSRVS
jgi:DNA topoisomerase-1